MDKITIRKAVPDDAPEILKVVESVHIKNLKNLDSGFLDGAKLDLGYYLKLIEERSLFYVAEVGGRIVGFAVAYPFGKHWRQNREYYLELFSGKGFMFIQHIGVVPAFQKTGIGRNLYERLFHDSGAEMFVAGVAKEPRNAASEAFHRSMGFKKADEHTWDDGVTGFVYVKNLNKKAA